MGFIKIMSAGTTDDVSVLWKNFVDYRTVEQTNPWEKREEKLVNGSRIALGSNQALVLFSGETYVDGMVGPGAYVYHEAFECGQYVAETKEAAELIRRAKPEAFSDTAGEEQELYLLCLTSERHIPFNFDSVTYYDAVYGISLVLQGQGCFETGIADTTAYYAAAGFSKEQFLTSLGSRIFEERKNILSEEFQHAFELALADWKDSGLCYNQLPYKTEALTGLVREKLKNSWEIKQGLQVVSMEFKSLYPDEASMLAIVKIHKEKGVQSVKPQQEQPQPDIRTTEPKAQPQQSNTYQQKPQNMEYQQQTQQTMQGSMFQRAQVEPFHYDSSRGLGAEVVLKKGACNWVKKPMLILNGNAVLTNQRFAYKKGMFNFVESLIANKFMGNGENSFEFYLSELAGIGEGTQGLTKTIVFYLKDGRSYSCFVYNRQEWLGQFYMLSK